MYIREIEQRLCQAIGVKKLPHSNSAANYINTKLKVAGIPVPVQREVNKKGFSFSEEKFEKQLSIWEDVFHSGEHHEIKSQALFFIERNFKKSDKEFIWRSLKGWIKSTDNWAHSDSLSGYYTKILEEHENLVLPQLQKWNKSKDLWERRQSIVSLLYYQRTKKKFLPYEEMVPLIENLLGDKEYYVQKGVGWALRELGQVYRKETKAFLEKNLHRITPVAFTASVEYMQTQEKERLKQRRKQIRSGIV
jgi:3-methyladenine DNA glycosylase AlkD